MMKNLRYRFVNSVNSSSHIAPLAVLRIVFGLVMFISVLRFILKGWVTDFYITPKLYFTFYGFDWIKPLGASGMFLIFGIMLLASLFILAGFFYRISIAVFFILFTYVELIDKTNYLNHYYFISIFAFLMILVPAHRYFSLDILRNPFLKRTAVPAWTINIFKLQLFIIYFYAGLSKVNYDWLIDAMPLRIWLPAHDNLPLIGPLLAEEWVAYLFSWFGMFYDLTIVFFLLNTKTRNIAYFFVIIFHLLTAWLFSIGMFPYIMILVTLIFYSENFHLRLIRSLRSVFIKIEPDGPEPILYFKISEIKTKLLYSLLFLYFVLQLLIPLRYLLYPGKLYWTEDGYRFSWRVMLMEKAGTTFFYVQDSKAGPKSEIKNSDFLTSQQERMMSTQPDMILQYAHFLAEEYKKRGMQYPVITVESYVTLNGSGSRLYIDSSVDLSKQEENLYSKKWVLPFKSK
jgi:hypothetical protein